MDWDTTPADQCGVSARSDDWCRRFFNNADVGTLTELGFYCGVEKTASDDWSVHAYRRSQATKTRRVFWNTDENGSFRLPLGTAVPWNSAWKPGGATDHHLCILDDSGPNGEVVGEWDFWEWSTAGTLGAVFNGANLKAGYTPGVHATAGTAAYWKAGSGNDGPFVVSPLLKGEVFPEEVKAGYVGHVIGIAVGGQCSMTGPEAAPGIDPDHSSIGTLVGCAASPCSQFESRLTISTPAQLARMVPDGARFRLAISKVEALRRLRENGHTGVLLKSLETIAYALIDFGMVIRRTTKAKAVLCGVGSNPALWNDLGFTTPTVADTAFHDLIRGPEDLVCCGFATSTPARGSKTRRSGPAVAVGYP